MAEQPDPNQGPPALGTCRVKARPLLLHEGGPRLRFPNTDAYDTVGGRAEEAGVAV